MKIKCIIIEDEPLAQLKLIDYVKEIEFLELESVFSSAVNLYPYLQENNIDLIFLDIQLGVLNGLDFLSTLRFPPKVIITTAYAGYAIKSYEYSVIDYLLKPFSFERFHLAVTKIYNLVNVKNNIDKPFIFVKTEYRIEKIDVNAILYIEGMKDYLKIVTANKLIITLMSFRKIMEVLPDCNFSRVHNSFIVAIDKINNVERDRIRIADTIIPISQSRRADFYKRIGSSLI